MIAINFTISSADAQQQMMTIGQCAARCKEECIVFVKFNALNSSLWMLIASMILLTLYYLLDTNEYAKREVAKLTKQVNLDHVNDTIRWLLFAGISLIIIYIAVFLISLQDIKPVI